MKRNERKADARPILFYSYDPTTDKTTITDGTTYETYTGKNLTLCVSLFKWQMCICKAVNLIRY